MSHHHFTLEDRNTIQNGLEDGVSHRDIALKLGVSHTAINKEVSNNSVVLELVATTRVNKPRVLTLDLRTRRGKGEVPKKVLARSRYQKRLARFERGQPAYMADIAHTLYLERRNMASSLNCKLEDGDELTERIAALLFSKTKDSPEQIAADLRKADVVIGYQTIYRWIKRSNRSKELTKRLRRRGRAYRYSHSTANAWNKTKHKRSIHERPIEIDELTRYGDLEGDTIFGSDKKDRILTHVDRLTGVLSLSLILGYDSYKIHQQTIEDLARVFGKEIHSITYDNGPEFTAWQKTEQALGASIYFADTYRSCKEVEMKTLMVW